MPGRHQDRRVTAQQAAAPRNDRQKPEPRSVASIDHAWNAAQSRVMGEWAGDDDAVFDDEPSG